MLWPAGSAQLLPPGSGHHVSSAPGIPPGFPHLDQRLRPRHNVQQHGGRLLVQVLVVHALDRGCRAQAEKRSEAQWVAAMRGRLKLVASPKRTRQSTPQHWVGFPPAPASPPGSAQKACVSCTWNSARFMPSTSPACSAGWGEGPLDGAWHARCLWHGHACHAQNLPCTGQVHMGAPSTIMWTVVHSQQPAHLSTPSPNPAGRPAWRPRSRPASPAAGSQSRQTTSPAVIAEAHDDLR